MPDSLARLAHQYRDALLQVLETVPARARSFVPPCVQSTSFVLAVTDRTGRTAIELRSRQRYPTLLVNGNEASPTSDTEPAYLAVESGQKLETIVFPGTSESSWPTWKLSGHAALHGLTFASNEFVSENCIPGFHAQFVGGDVPFEVQSDGGILAVNVANGLLVDGRPEIKVTEWLRVFGSKEMLPRTEVALQELAITDLASAAFKLPDAEPKWDFSGFLSSLKEPVDQSVLLLGSYAVGDRFSETAAALERLGYRPFLLKDSPDLPIQRNLEKLFAAVMFSSFIVMIDDLASGHIAELSTLLQFHFRPLILLRRNNYPATSFLEDSVLTDGACRVEILDQISASNLAPAIRWARQWLANQEEKLDSINHWRTPRSERGAE
ncbi:MAG: hypothetical protein QMB52_03955 [Propionivibrio sp.]